jgi:hypothetical protein
MEMKSLTSLKLRSAWMPPAVAQAPMVKSLLDARRIAWIRSASWGVVIDPSTSDRSYGHRARRLREIGDVDLAGDQEQLVFAIEQAELAAVAR